MADSTVTDVSKMKVVDLRKELKSRGLPYAGDKADLVERLKTAMTHDAQDDHAEINLDSDEIDSDSVLEDDDKTHDILDSTVDTLNEALALEEQKPAEELKSPRTLKRKLKVPETDKEKSADTKESGHKKIVLNRAISLSSVTPQPVSEKTEEDKLVKENPPPESTKVKITADLDSKTKLELRAKRFGLPVKVTDADRKEARKQRFGQNAQTTTSALPVSIDKLKKRAERFGQSVSTAMTDLENKEKLEKRRAKFGTVN